MQMKNIASIATMAIFAAFVYFAPLVMAAQSNTGLIPCTGTDCNQCHLVQLADNVIGWLIMFLTVVAVIALVIAGFKLVASGGNSSALQAAKETFINILIGFILVLAAWLIVDTLLKTATGKGLEKWGKVECGSQVQSTSDSAAANNPAGSLRQLQDSANSTLDNSVDSLRTGPQ